MGFFYVWRQNVDEHVGVGQRVCPSRFVASNSISNSMTHFYSHHCGTRLSRESSGQATWAATVKLSSWHHKQSLPTAVTPKAYKCSRVCSERIEMSSDFLETGWWAYRNGHSVSFECLLQYFGRCLLCASMRFKYKIKNSVCVWVCVNNAVSLEGEKQKGKTSGKNSKWKL